MIDLSRVRKYYVACGYTDLRRGIDGLAAIVCQQYGRKLRSTAAEGMPQIEEVELPAEEDKVYIRFRGAELTLPAGTDIEAIAAVLRSLQQL